MSLTFKTSYTYIMIGTTLRDYLDNHQEEINQYRQQGFSWSPKYNRPIFKKIKAWDDIIEGNTLPETLDRTFVKKLFKTQNTYYQGFVSALMWRGISATRPKTKGNQETTNFYFALSAPPQKIVQDLMKTRDLLASGKIKEAFEAYHRGSFKINGLGPSYFTKLFYFLGAACDFKPLPLIYDKWTRYIHLWLSLSNDTLPETSKYYTLPDRFDGRPILNRTGAESNGYLDYVEKFNQLCTDLHLPPANAEAYLFGKPFKGKVNKDPEYNPRAFMLSQLNNSMANKN